MRKLLLTSLLIWPALCMAQTGNSNPPVNKVVSTSMRVMSIEPTQTVDFDGSLKQLRGRLQLMQVQQSVWVGFERSVQAYSELFFAEKPVSVSAGDSAPRQVELMLGQLQKRANAMKEIARETKELYAVLNAEQQKTADLYLLASIPVFGNPPNAH